MRQRFIVGVNVASQLVGKLITSSTIFIISILLAQALGPSGYGDFIKITTFVSLFYLFADFGLNAMYVQQGARAWPALVSLRVLISFLLMFVAFSVLVFLPSGINQGYTDIVKLGIILSIPTILFQSFLTSGNAIFQQHLRYDLATVAISTGSIFSLVSLIIALSIFQPSVILIVCIVLLTIGAALSGGVSLLLTRRFVPFQFALSWGEINKLFIPAIPLGLLLVANLIYFRADSIILTLTRPTAEVGLYGFAYKIFEFVLAVPTFVMNALYPILLKAQAENKNQFTSLFRTSAIGLTLVSIIFSISMWLLAPLITLIRPEFAGAISALRILSLGLPFFFLSSLIMWTLLVYKKQKQLLLVYCSIMVWNIGLNLLFIPQLGFEAAAWITIISEACILLITSLVLRTVMKA